jgi:hypothetical protein
VLQLDILYKSHSLFPTLTLYLVAQMKPVFGINSKTDEVVQLQLHSIFGSIFIGQGNLSPSSKFVRETIGILKNTAIFCQRFSNSQSGVIFNTFACSITFTI